MIKKQLFSYWEGPMPAYIRHCLMTIKDRCGVPVRVIDAESADKMIGKVLNSNYKKIKVISQKCDCIRLALIYLYGGMWCDADTICLKSFEPLFENDGFTGFRWEHSGSILNGYFLAPKSDSQVENCLNDVNESLKKGKSYYSDSSGVFFGETLFNRSIKEINSLPLRMVLPFNFAKTPNIWQSNLDISDHIKEDTVAIGLNFSHLSWINSNTVEQLRERNDLIGRIFEWPKIRKIPEVQRQTEKNIYVTEPTNDMEVFGPHHPDWNNPGKAAKKNKWLLANGRML